MTDVPPGTTRRRSPTAHPPPSVAGSAPRERLAGRERRDLVRAGPPITVRCPCGECHETPYGQRRTCSCGLSWDTNQIEQADYQRLRRLHRRYHVLIPAGLGLMTCGLALALFATHNLLGLFTFLPIVLIVRSLVVRPLLTRRYTIARAQLTRWTLRPVTPQDEQR